MVLVKHNLQNPILLIKLTLTLVFLILVLGPQKVSAGAGGENRVPANSAETAARNKCIAEGWDSLRYGAIWVSDIAGSYYDYTQVTVGSTATTATVYIRGSVFGCHSTATNNTYAVDIEEPVDAYPNRLSGLTSTSLFRGKSQGQHDWSTQGGQITAQLNVSGLAGGPTYTQTINISLWRCFSTNSTSATGACYTQVIPIVIKRTPPATDVCNNIPGNQATIPAGKVSDGAGGCVDPPPDVCNNIAGNQASIPPGKVSDGAGGCVDPPIPATSCSPPASFVFEGDSVTFTGGGGNGTFTWDGSYTGNPYTKTFPTAGPGQAQVVSNGQTAICNVTVRKRPYFQAYGGDTLAGTSFETGSSCTVSPGRRQLGFTKQSGGLYFGAGVQHATYATGSIVEFASGILENAPSGNNSPINRTFSSNSGGTYGGEFPTTSTSLLSSCAQDYFSKQPSSGFFEIIPASFDISSTNSANTAYVKAGPLTINQSAAKNVNDGVRATIYVDGDVYIANNIGYANDGAYDPASPVNIPSFRLVVRGNIYVSPNVTALRGTYIAQPNGGSGGVFYTCAPTAFDLPNDDASLYGNGANQCGQNKLTVYGAVIANAIKLQRTIGTVPGAPDTFTNNGNGSQAAEQFIFTPDIWLNSNATSTMQVQSYTALPPIL